MTKDLHVSLLQDPLFLESESGFILSSWGLQARLGLPKVELLLSGF